MKGRFVAVLGVCALLLVLVAGVAQAQILMVTGNYRITHVDRAEQRIGIALRDANPNVRQNWVYVKADTQIVKRVWRADGSSKDENWGWNQFFEYAKKGTLVRVHGGRDWNGTIDAKKIWL